MHTSQQHFLICRNLLVHLRSNQFSGELACAISPFQNDFECPEIFSWKRHKIKRIGRRPTLLYMSTPRIANIIPTTLKNDTGFWSKKRETEITAIRFVQFAMA